MWVPLEIVPSFSVWAEDKHVCYSSQYILLICLRWPKLESSNRRTGSGSYLPHWADQECCRLSPDHLWDSGGKDLPPTDLQGLHYPPDHRQCQGSIQVSSHWCTVGANPILWEQVALKGFLKVSLELCSLRVMGWLFHSLGAALENAVTPKCVLLFPWSTGDAKTRLGGGPQMMHWKVVVMTEFGAPHTPSLFTTNE